MAEHLSPEQLIEGVAKGVSESIRLLNYGRPDLRTTNLFVRGVELAVAEFLELHKAELLEAVARISVPLVAKFVASDEGRKGGE